MKKSFCFIFCMIAVCCSLHAVTWDGAVSADWFTDANWAGGLRPAADDDVVIDGNSGNHPTLDLSGGAVTIRSLTLGASAVSVLTVSNGDDNLKKLNITQNLDIGAHGILTHAQNSNADTHKLNIAVGNNVIIAAGGLIDVTRKGRTSGGAGAGGTHYGGSYGGQGGYANVGSMGVTYGSHSQPIDLGNPGGGSGPGGGAIILSAAGAVTLNGGIYANGTNAGAAGGSGGSVFVSADNVSGNGGITVNGGNGSGSYRSGGGGGRIAVVLASGEDIDAVTATAYGGPPNSANAYGAAGTVYIRTPSFPNGRLIVDNAGNQAFYGKNISETCIPSGQAWVPDKIILRNRGRLYIGTGAALTVSDNATIESDNDLSFLTLVSGGTLNVPPHFTFENMSMRIVDGTDCFLNGLTGSLRILNGGSLVVDNELELDVDVTVESGARITHSQNTDTNDWRMILTINANLTVNAGGSIDADGRGYSSGTQIGSGSSNCGGSHGGRAGQANVGVLGTTYGSIQTPITLGGKGGDAGGGGGAVFLDIKGHLEVDGKISADGGRQIGNSGGGAGGSVWLISDTLDGSGFVTANGAAVTNTLNSYSGPGGGGRVAVYLEQSVYFGNVSFLAATGEKWHSYSRYGGAGTVYLKTTNDVHGTLIVDNTGRISSGTPFGSTLINTNVTEAVAGNVLLRDDGWLHLATNEFFEVYGNWTNSGGRLVSDSGSSVIFRSDVMNVTGSNDFWNLVITNGGQQVTFQAGKTNTVFGLLDMNRATVLSSTLGEWSYLTLAPDSEQNVRLCRVRDSNASGGHTITNQLCVLGSDFGNNINWVFDYVRGNVIYFF